MNRSLFLVLLISLDLLCFVLGLRVGLVLIFPLVLFFDRQSISRVLFIGLIIGVALEALYGFFAGSLTLGMGFAFLVFHISRTVIDWRQLLVRISGLVVYILLIYSTRSLLSLVIDQIWLWYSPVLVGGPLGFGVIWVLVSEQIHYRQAREEIHV